MYVKIKKTRQNKNFRKNFAEKFANIKYLLYLCAKIPKA